MLRTHQADLREDAVARGRTKASIGCMAVALVAASAACGGSSTSGTSGDAGSGAAAGVELIKPGKLVTCTHLDYPPFQARRGDKIEGFDVDVVDAVAKDLGVTQEILDTSFEGIESGESLSTKQCDVAAAAMSITDVRKTKLDFSESYFEARQALLVKKGASVKDLAALKGKKLGAQLATTGEEYANKNKDANGYDVVQFEDLPLEVTAVQTGQIDAAINDNSVLFDFIKNNADVEVSAEFDTGDNYGIGVAKGNTKLLEKVNATLARLKKDGEYDKIYEKWIGKKPS
jgi:polar amino acid transport system substrate-binding protein